MVTGGAGFIGVNVASHWLDLGYRVIVYDTLEHISGAENLEWLRNHPRSDNLNVLVGDVRSPTAALEQEIESSEALFHMAAQVAVTSSVLDPVTDFEINAVGTLKMLELVRKSKGLKPFIVYASTNKV
jgi:CDP-paratose 2-epimerase